jgi:hypothetical protein
MEEPGIDCHSSASECNGMEMVKILWLGAVILFCAFVCLVVRTEFRIVTRPSKGRFLRRTKV